MIKVEAPLGFGDWYALQYDPNDTDRLFRELVSVYGSNIVRKVIQTGADKSCDIDFRFEALTNLYRITMRPWSWLIVADQAYPMYYRTDHEITDTYALLNNVEV